MNLIKISELTQVEEPTLTDSLPIVNDNETKIITLEQIVNVAKANITILAIKLVSSVDDVVAENILYLVPTSEDEGNIYNEYMLINNKVEKVGSQDIDLTPYAKTTDVKEMIDIAITGALEGSY